MNRSSRLLSRVPRNSCIQRRRLYVSKTVRNEQAARNKKAVLDLSGVVSCVGKFFENQERLACVRCPQNENRIKVSWLLLFILTTTWHFLWKFSCWNKTGSYFNIARYIQEFLFNLLMKMQDKKPPTIAPLPFLSMYALIQYSGSSQFASYIVAIKRPLSGVWR